MSGLLRWMSVLALACALGACGDDSGGSDAGGGDGDGDGDGDMNIEPISETINADEGGEIETTGAAITIPGGALSEDTEITVEVILASDVPEADSLASLVYDFGPDGTTFSEPVELTIDLNADVPSGMKAQLAWLDEAHDEWVPLADSHVDGDQVVGTTDHFTMFAIVLTATMGQTAGSCEDFDTFEACGGDLEGTWEFSLACADLTLQDIFGEDNEIATCQGTSLSANLDFSGSITFEAGGDYQSDITRAVDFEINLPLDCLPTGAMCSQLDNMQEGSEVTEEDGVCMLSMHQDPETETKAGTYELDGNSVILTADGEDPDEPSEYCVQGNTLTVRSIDVDDETGEETVFFLQATRQ